MSQELGNSGIIADYKDGKGSLSAFDGAVELNVYVAKFLNKALDEVAAKIESGEIDPIKGTNIDKEIALQVLAYVKVLVNK